MSDVSAIEDAEVLLRRVRPSTPQQEFVAQCGDGSLRASSWAMRTQAGEHGLSCTRLLMTSPRALLEQLSDDSTGWQVARFYARDVREAGLEVIHLPTDTDPGHCELRGPSRSPYPNKKSQCQWLAKRTRILTDIEVQDLRSGDLVAD